MAQKSKWSVEALEGLRDLEALFPQGKVVLFPIIQDWGRSIKWDSRIYPKGAAGVLPVTKEGVMAIGGAEAEAEEMVATTERALVALRKLYPVMIPELERRLKELEAAVPKALLEAEPARVSD
ncbi:hypothetical protein ES703_57265 [subsurface metagenome]